VSMVQSVRRGSQGAGYDLTRAAVGPRATLRGVEIGL